jgi:hypothetical protein
VTVYPIIPTGYPLAEDHSRPINVTDLAASKYVASVRYVKKYSPQTGVSTIDVPEVAEYRRLQRPFVLNYEDLEANWMLGGYDVGRSRGDFVAAELDRLGIADIATVYAAADFNTGIPSQIDAVMECQRGFTESRLGKRGRGIYGFILTLEEARRRGLADYFWLCGDGVVLFDGDWRAGNRVRTWVNLWQQNNFQVRIAGVACDENYILTPDYGQYPGPSQEDDMSAEIEQMVREIHFELTQRLPDRGAGDPAVVDTLLGHAINSASFSRRIIDKGIPAVIAAVSAVAAANGSSLTPAQISQAVHDGMASGVQVAVSVDGKVVA